jgi:hypothetical protein
MAKKRSAEKVPAAKSPREQEIADLREIGRDGRTEEQSARLSLLLSDERRERFTRLMPKRMARLRSAFRGIRNIAAPQSYQYTEEEAQNISAAVIAAANEVKRLFTGAPKEKGLYDL